MTGVAQEPQAPTLVCRRPVGTPRVLISNGFNRFHLAVAAEEAARRGSLHMLVTGAYPTRGATLIARIARPLGAARIGRLLDRSVELPTTLISPSWRAELVHEAATAATRLGMRRLGGALDVASTRSYARRAGKIVRNSRAHVYHYRSGFGGPSVEEARARGLVALCDHSIAHPALVEHLVAHRGRLSRSDERTHVSPFWRHVLDDVQRADHVVVNSAFVKETFVYQGWDPKRVDVVYWGVDDAFLDVIPSRPAHARGPLRLAFAGHLAGRKGAHELERALAQLDDVDWTLAVAGAVDREDSAASALIRDHRVLVHGTVTRPALAGILAETDVFVFPSLAEGSARVVFEALAAGCYVVTTPNAGSIVEDGVHGALVPVGDQAAVAAAIRHAAEDRERLATIGARNAQIVREQYRQEHYGDELTRLYARLADRKQWPASMPFGAMS
jgi:glycosyltransferase involved in cell wall biosynthesis